MMIPRFSILDWNSSGIDANGVEWKTRDLTGWDEPSPARSDSTPRPNANGAFDAPVYDDTRVIGWSGSATAPDTATRAAAKLKLGQIARALRDGADVIGHADDGDYTVHAKRAGGWNVAPLGPLGFEYQLVITCTDPYKYGPQVSASTGLPTAGTGGLVFPLFDVSGLLTFGTPGASGRVTLSNSGTAESWPTFTVTAGVLGGLSLTDVNSGARIVYAGDAPDGSVLVIDAAQGRAALNGADRTGQLTVKQWWSVPPGGSSTVQFATLGASGQVGQLAASIFPAYE